MEQTISIKVTILGWNKINGRKDVKEPSWFKVKHKFFDDSEFYDFTHSEIVFWFYLLCECSKQNKAGVVTVNSQHAHRAANISVTVIESSLQKLQRIGVVEVRTLRGRYAAGTQTSPRQEEIGLEERRGEEKREEKSTATPKKPAVSAATWNAYALAYEKRYRTLPVRNAGVNSMLAGLVKKLGEIDAPLVAEFFVFHNDRFYVNAMHPVNLLNRDAEKLRTEWFTGNRITGGKAREIERKQDNREVFGKLIAEAEAEERANE